MWLLPILTSFNLPIDIIRGKVNMVNMLWYVGLVAVFTIANYRIWHAGLKKYQSSNQYFMDLKDNLNLIEIEK